MRRRIVRGGIDAPGPERYGREAGHRRSGEASAQRDGASGGREEAVDLSHRGAQTLFHTHPEHLLECLD